MESGAHRRESQWQGLPAPLEPTPRYQLYLGNSSGPGLAPDPPGHSVCARGLLTPLPKSRVPPSPRKGSICCVPFHASPLFSPPDRLLGLYRPPGLHLLLRPSTLALGEAAAAAAVLPAARYGRVHHAALWGLQPSPGAGGWVLGVPVRILLKKPVPLGC